MCDSYKLASIIKLPLKRPARKDELFAEHIITQTQCALLSQYLLQCVPDAWKTSTAMHKSCYYTYLQK